MHAPQERLGSAQPLDRRLQEALERGQVRRDTVGHGVFELSPDKLVRVKFRSIAGERIGMQAPVAGQQPVNGSGSVGPSPIPQQDHGAPDVAQEVPKELGHFRCSNVLVGVESHIQRHAPSLRGHPQSRDRRDLGPPACHRPPRGLPAWGPGADHVRDEQEPARVEKDQRGPTRSGLLFYAATRGASNYAISASLRSRARFCGFWQLQPKPTRSLHMWLE